MQIKTEFDRTQLCVREDNFNFLLSWFPTFSHIHYCLKILLILQECVNVKIWWDVSFNMHVTVTGCDRPWTSIGGIWLIAIRLLDQCLWALTIKNVNTVDTKLMLIILRREAVKKGVLYQAQSGSFTLSLRRCEVGCYTCLVGYFSFCSVLFVVFLRKLEYLSL